MEPKSNLITKFPFYLLSRIFTYLPFSDFKNAILTCSQFYAARKYFLTNCFFNTMHWDFLDPPALPEKAYKNFVKIMKANFISVSSNISFDPLENEQVFKYDPKPEFSHRGIKTIKITYDFDSTDTQKITPSLFCLTFSGSLLFYKQNSDKNSWKFIQEISTPKFTQIECSKSLCALTESGKIYDVEINENDQFSLLLEISGINEKISQIGCTLKNHFCVTENNEVFYWKIGERKAQKIDCPKNKILQISCESMITYILYEKDYKIYIIDENLNNEKLVAILCPELTKLKLSKISSGIAHSLGLYQEKYSPMKFWSTEILITWLEKINFAQIIELISIENITGEQFFKMNKEELGEKFEFLDEDLLAKLNYEKNKCEVETYGKSTLYGWGANRNGQLATKSNTCKYNAPVNIPLPEINGEIIKNILCGFKTSALITDQGTLFISGNIKPVKKPEKPIEKPSKKSTKSKPKKASRKHKENSSDDENAKNSDSDEEKPTKDKGHKKKSKKLLEEEKSKLEKSEEKHNLEKSLKHRWINFGKLLNDKLKSEVYLITMWHKEILISYNLTKIGHDGKHKIGQKFSKSADKILKQIAWDERLKNGKFSVGYEDRFLGIIEKPYEEFSNSEVPLHRVQYIKKDGNLVWDRKTRLNKLT